MAPSELVCVLAVKIVVDASERQPKNRLVYIWLGFLLFWHSNGVRKLLHMFS